MYHSTANQEYFPGYKMYHGGDLSLLIPHEVLAAMLTKRKEAAERALESEVSKSEKAASAPQGRYVEVVADDYFRPVSGAVEIFPRKAIANCSVLVNRGDSDTRNRLKSIIDRLDNDDGMRFIPELENEIIDAITGSLTSRFPNFAPVIEHIKSELTLAMASRPEEFRIAPILLHGVPGIGKTTFVMAVAKALNVGFEQITAAGIQGPFDLVGTSSHWSTSSPGKVIQMLIDGEYACPVLMIDELDKLPDNSEHPIVPALLSLLEPVSAKHFHDEALHISFDASRLIVLGTANDINAVKGPLRSRMKVIEVLAPTTAERRQITASVFQQLTRGLVVELAIDDQALDALAETSLDVRAISRCLRTAISAAIQCRRDRIDVNDLQIEGAEPARKIGFV